MERWTNSRVTRDGIKGHLDADHASGGFEHDDSPFSQFFSRPNGQPVNEHENCTFNLPNQPITPTLITHANDRIIRHSALGSSYERAKQATATIAAEAKESFDRLKDAAQRFVTKKGIKTDNPVQALRERIAEYNEGKYKEKSDKK